MFQSANQIRLVRHYLCMVILGDSKDNSLSKSQVKTVDNRMEQNRMEDIFFFAFFVWWQINWYCPQWQCVLVGVVRCCAFFLVGLRRRCNALLLLLLCSARGALFTTSLYKLGLSLFSSVERCLYIYVCFCLIAIVWWFDLFYNIHTSASINKVSVSKAHSTSVAGLYHYCSGN